MYTLVVVALLVIYFILEHRRDTRHPRDDSNYSYGSGSGSVIDERRRPSRLTGLAEGAAAGVGLGALANRFRNRSHRTEAEVVGSRRHSGSYVEEEKYSQYGRDPGREGGGLRSKLLGIGVISAAAYWLTRLAGRKHEEENEDDHNSGTTEDTEDSLDRVERAEAGRLPPSGQHPLNQVQTQPLNHRRSDSILSDESYVSGSPSRQRRGHGLRDAVLGLGAVGLVGSIFKKRKERKEQRRIDELRDQEIEDERIARQNSQRRYTGDGVLPPPPRRGGGNRVGSASASNNYLAEDTGRDRIYTPPPPPGIVLPVAAGVAGAAAGAAYADRNREETTFNTNNPVLSGPPPSGPGAIPPTPPDHRGAFQHDSSGSEMYTSASGRQHRRHRSGDAALAGLAGGAAGLAAGEGLANRRNRNRSSNRQSASAGEESVGSQGPVSVKVKMHSDGRHVTLRRLPEEEAAAERAARRSSRDGNGRRRRTDSNSTLSGAEGGVGGERWRRTEALERQQAMDMERERANLHAAQAQINQSRMPAAGPSQPPIGPGYLAPGPLPPPIPQTSSPLGPAGSVGSPGTYDGTATEASDYATNRRRRRAERAQAKLAREGRQGQGQAQGMEYT